MIDQIISHPQLSRMKMKLNLRPNDRNRSANSTFFWLIQNALTSLPIISMLIITVNCVELPIPQHQNEVPRLGQIPSSQNNSSKQLDRDVKELHLMPDFRSIKLQWSYEHSDANEPAAFTVRFCELTSWNVEIKCRQRDLRVDPQPDSRRQANSVISSAAPTSRQPIDTVHQLNPPRGPHYEAQIYDLRALTNYTFQVRVARFSHEQPVGLLLPSPGASRQQAARTLGGSGLSPRQEIDWPLAGGEGASRVETKPFGAEATKCLWDVSEVVVNTGRYFGGRISVEDSADPRCNLLGNKSSEQTSYLFRIDHELCGSRIVDGNRIETMVLVHEHKDILTHNTARFLVLCNFLQKSFTLRASISLPKVNGLIAQSRPAVITSLPRKPDTGSANEDRATSVLLGTMPGIYRARVAHQADEQQANQPQQGLPVGSSSSSKAPLSNLIADANFDSAKASVVDELETNTIEKIGGKEAVELQQLAATNSGANAAKQAALVRRRNSNSLEQGSRARALTLSPSTDSGGGGGRLIAPQPVQVQSKVLFVERGADMARTGRRHHYNRLSGINIGADRHQEATNPAPVSRLDTVEVLQRAPSAATVVEAAVTTTTVRPTPKIDRDGGSKDLKQSTTRATGLAAGRLFASSATEDDDLQTGSITMTNNHRISGDYPQVGSLNTKLLNDNNSTSNYSIKYSALAKVDEYPLSVQTDQAPFVELHSEGANQMSNLLTKPRNNPILDDGQRHRHIGSEPLSRYRQLGMPMSRMGEMSTENGDDLFADTSNVAASRQQVVTPIPIQNSTLAQNITSYLLRWSLKTLTNLAKKSLETLMSNDSRLNDTELLVGGPPSEEHLTPVNYENQPEHEFQLTRQHQEPIKSGQTTRKPPEVSIKRTTTAPVDSTENSVQSKQISSHNETVRAMPVVQSSTLPSTIREAANVTKPTEEIHDGFITDGKRTEEKPVQTRVRHRPIGDQSVHQQTGRPSNYSKSLDFNKAETLSRTRAASERAKLNAAGQRQRAGHLDLAPANMDSNERHEPHWNESVWSSRDGSSIFRSGWLFCGAALFVALITGVFLTFWLVSAPNRSLSGSLEQQVSGTCAERPSSIAFNNPTQAGLMFDGGNANTSNGGANDVSYQKYDYSKFDNYPNKAVNNHKVNLLPAAGAKIGRPSAQSPSIESQSTRSTSAGSTLWAADENDCKNNEFLYTGHVLLSTGSSLGESYA